MSLITDIAKLQELEQKATPGKWQWYNTHYPGGPAIIPESGEAIAELYQKTRPDEDGMFIAALRNLAPAMLEVLGCFKEGDEDLLVEYIYQFTEEYGVDGVVFSDTAFGKFMKRMQKAASIMEQEEREG